MKRTGWGIAFLLFALVLTTSGQNPGPDVTLGVRSRAAPSPQLFAKTLARLHQAFSAGRFAEVDVILSDLPPVFGPSIRDELGQIHTRMNQSLGVVKQVASELNDPSTLYSKQHGDAVTRASDAKREAQLKGRAGAASAEFEQAFLDLQRVYADSDRAATDANRRIFEANTVAREERQRRERQQQAEHELEIAERLRKERLLREQQQQAKPAEREETPATLPITPATPPPVRVEATAGATESSRNYVEVNATSETAEPKTPSIGFHRRRYIWFGVLVACAAMGGFYQLFSRRPPSLVSGPIAAAALTHNLGHPGNSEPVAQAKALAIPDAVAPLASSPPSAATAAMADPIAVLDAEVSALLERFSSTATGSGTPANEIIGKMKAAELVELVARMKRAVPYTKEGEPDDLRTDAIYDKLRELQKWIEILRTSERLAARRAARPSVNAAVDT